MNPESQPIELRATDRDRDAAAHQVQEAVEDGRLSLDELHERLGQVYSARTTAELSTIVADLGAPATRPAHGRRSDLLRITANNSGQKRTGRWHVPPQIIATANFSRVKLDFTDAVLHSKEVAVEANANASAVILIVPHGWSVDIEDVICQDGSAKNKAVAPEPGAPHLVVTGTAGAGNVVVRHRRRWFRK